jgi:hypothetical protein
MSTTTAAASNGRRLELAPVKKFQKFCSTTRCGVRVCVYTQSMTTTQPNPTETETTKMNENLIPTNGEARGALYYTTLATGEMKHVLGNFQIDTDGRTVIARNLGGRNRYRFITVDQVIDFIPDTK